jgi:hypothetical protein
MNRDIWSPTRTKLTLRPYNGYGSEAWAEFYAWFFDQRCEDFDLDGMAADEVMWRGYWGTDEADLRDYSSVEEITQTCYLWLQRVDSRMQHELITQAYWSEAQQYHTRCLGGDCLFVVVGNMAVVWMIENKWYFMNQ